MQGREPRDMSKIMLDINTTSFFNSEEEARRVGQTIDLILGGTQKSAQSQKAQNLSDKLNLLLREESGLNKDDIDLILKSIASLDGDTQGSVKLRQGFTSIALYEPKPDKSNWTRDGQLIDGRINSLVKNIRTAIPAVAEVDITTEVKVLDGKIWIVDYQRLFDNVAAHTDRTEALPLFKDAVALTLQNETLRGVK
jgi:hypothetical protein